MLTQVFEMTERAQRIMRAYEAEDTYNFPKDGVVSAIRELNKHFDEWGGDEPSCCVFSEIHSIIEELEAL
jgi:hypothetical protein